MISVNVLKLPLVHLAFQLRKDYIASNLCENKDVVNSTCNGKCYLKKQLKKAEADTENNESQAPRKIQLEEYCSLSLLNLPTANYNLIKPHFSVYKSLYSFRQSVDIFHPPQLV